MKEAIILEICPNVRRPIYEQLFNIIFQTGIVPDNCLMGNIKPLYKNKGDKVD